MKKLTSIALTVTMTLLLACMVNAAEPVVYFSFDSSPTEAVGAEAEVDGTVEIVDGKVGKAASFDGSSTVDVTTDYDDLLKSTFMAWVKTDGVISDYYSIFSGPWEGTNVHFNITSSGVIEIGVSDASWLGGRVSFSPVNDDEWHHIAVTYDIDESVMNIYIDGELDSECEPIQDNGLNFSSFTIGSWNNGRYFNGLIDEVQIFDSVLSEAEIKAYASGTVSSAKAEEPAAAPAEPEPEVVDEPEATESATVEAANVVEATVPSAPETSDMGVMICIAGLVISIGAFAVTKKKSI